jgi:hypothetical protein
LARLPSLPNPMMPLFWIVCSWAMSYGVAEIVWLMPPLMTAQGSQPQQLLHALEMRRVELVDVGQRPAQFLIGYSLLICSTGQDASIVLVRFAWTCSGRPAFAISVAIRRPSQLVGFQIGLRDIGRGAIEHALAVEGVVEVPLETASSARCGAAVARSRRRRPAM